MITIARVTDTLRFDVEHKLVTQAPLSSDDYDAVLAIIAEDVELRESADSDRETAEQSETDLQKDLANTEEKLRAAESRLEALPDGLVEAEGQIERLEAVLAELRKRYWALLDDNNKLRRNQRKATLQIRAGMYRGREGFTVSGQSPAGKRVKIFAVTRAAAEHIRNKVKAGQELTTADFGSIQ